MLMLEKIFDSNNAGESNGSSTYGTFDGGASVVLAESVGSAASFYLLIQSLVKYVELRFFGI
jgi:hypothetical protein